MVPRAVRKREKPIVQPTSVDVRKQRKAGYIIVPSSHTDGGEGAKRGWDTDDPGE